MRALPLAAVVLLTGCAGTNIPGLESLRPTVDVQQLEVARITFEALETNLVLAVANPYPFDVDMTRLRWSLALADVVEVGGQRAGTNLAAGRESQLSVPFTLRWADVLPAVRAVASGDGLPWTLTGTGTFDSPVGELQVPFDATGTLDPLWRPNIGS